MVRVVLSTGICNVVT